MPGEAAGAAVAEAAMSSGPLIKLACFTSNRPMVLGAVITAALAIVSPGCTSTHVSPETCQIGDLAKVYDAPLAAVGKTFCGEVFAELRWPEVVLLPRKEWKSEKDLTVLLDSQSNDRLRQLWKGRTSGHVRLKARIEGDEDCLNERARDERFACTPLRHPLVLSASTLELIG